MGEAGNGVLGWGEGEQEACHEEGEAGMMEGCTSDPVPP